MYKRQTYQRYPVTDVKEKSTSSSTTLIDKVKNFLQDQVLIVVAAAWAVILILIIIIIVVGVKLRRRNEELDLSLIHILIKLTAPGPLIFKQERIGLQNKPFYMYKFRSMIVQKESEEKKGWTTKDDPRVTPVGKFIRKTSIDELPQLFNVLKGDMSLVGPRPERPLFVEKFKEEIPRYMIKMCIRDRMKAVSHGMIRILELNGRFRKIWN